MVRFILPLLFSVALGPTAWAQQRAPELPASQQRHIERFLSLHISTAPLSARTTTEVLAQMDGSFWDDDWVLTQRTTHTYDGPHRDLSMHYAADVGNPLDLIGRTARGYDAAGRLTEHREETWNGSAFTPNLRDLYTYDGAGLRPLTVVTQGYTGVGWDNAERMAFTFDGAGNLTGGQFDYWSGSAWMPASRFLLAEVGNDVVYTDQEWDGTDWQNTERSTYLNQTLATLTAELDGFEAITNDYVGLFLIAAFVPDGIHEAWTGEAWELQSRQITTRFFEGGTLQRVEKTIETWLGASWEPEARTALTYDPSEQLELVELQTPLFEGEWLSLLVEAYTHTDTGRIETAQQSAVLDIEWEGRGEPTLVPLALYALFWHLPTTQADEQPDGAAIALEAPFPNPTSGLATVVLNLSADSHVALRVYDVLGRHVFTVVEQSLPTGRHFISLDGSSLPAGRYFVRLEGNGVSAVRGFTLVH